MMRDYLISFPMLGQGFVLEPPTSFSVFGFPVYYYGLIIGIGFLLALIYCLKRSRQFGITQDSFTDVLLFAVPLAIVCARLYYVVFQWQDYADNLMGIFNIREGGIAVYGSIIGAVIGTVIACRWRKLSIGAVLDLGALGLLIGQSVGRWANFVNREAFGSETAVFWRMGLTNPGTGQTMYVHPTFLYESLWNFIGFLLLHFFTKKGKKHFDGQIFVMYAAWYGLGRMFIEGLRTDSLYIPGTLIRVSQLLAALSFVAAMVFLVIMLRRAYEPQSLWVNSPRAAQLAGVFPNVEISEINTASPEESGAESHAEDMPKPEPAEFRSDPEEAGRGESE
jgi:prolipoprotein diacylglyceryl transferase